MQQELNTKTEEQKKVLSDLLKLENEYNSNYKNLSEINAKLSNDTFNKSSKENKLSVLKTKTFESCDDIEEIKTKIKGLTSEKENIQKELEGYKDIKNTKDLLNEIEPLKTAINEDNIIIEKNALIMKTNLDNKNKCLELEAENLKLLEEIGVLNNKISSIKEAYDYLNRLLPQFISKSICDNLENRINHFIHKIFPKYEVKLETNEKGCELFYTKDKTIMDEKRNKFIKTRMSSGLERSILNLAFKVSLAESYNLEMFVGDEIDQSSNDRDAKILMDLLINSNSFEQLFIISHKPAVLEHISDNYKGNIYLADNGKFTKSSF